MKNPIIIIVFVIFVQWNSFAQETPKLSGIMQGDMPSAIINDKLVTVGETVDGYRIVEIGADYVECESARGSLRLSLVQPKVSNEQSKERETAGLATVSTVSLASAQGTQQQMQLKAAKFLERSIDHLKEADRLLKSPLVFERLYAGAIELCDAADREAQSAMRSVTGDAPKAGIADHTQKIRKAREAIVKEKAEFTTRIRALIAANQVATGMTQRDVVSSWGQPLMQNRDGVLEKWVYQDANGLQKELVFKDGILISF